MRVCCELAGRGALGDVWEFDMAFGLRRFSDVDGLGRYLTDKPPPMPSRAFWFLQDDT